MSFTPGSRLLHYEIAELIGKGGMGEVYRARDTKLERDVAIKVLPAEFSESAERIARFEREAKLLASLNHPNIAAIHGVESSDEVRFLVLELVPGETLAERIARGPLTVEDALEIAEQIVSALENAHDRGIVHRDLKPANVKLTPDGDVKVLDFGLAKAAETESEASLDSSRSPTLTKGTALGVIMGTAAYMSPEQARGQSVDKRSDIWAFGVVLLEMLRGKRLFEGPTVADTLAAVIGREPDLEALPDDVPQSIRRLLQRCLVKDKKRRLPDIGVARLEIADARSESMSPPAAPGRQRPSRFTMGFAAVGLIGLGALISTWLMKSPVSDEPILHLSLTLPEENALLNLDNSRQLAISRDGSTLAYTAAGALYVRRLDEDASTPLDGTFGAVSPFFSPDGEWIAFSQGNELKKIPVGGGTSVSLVERTLFVGGCWGVDDTIVYSSSGGIYRVPASGGDSELLVGPPRGQFASHPYVLPDGSAVLHTETNANVISIVATSLRDGTSRTLLERAARPVYLPSGHLLYTPLGSVAEIRAVAFDAERLEVIGSGVTVLSDVLIDRGAGAAQFDVSDTGTAVYIPTVDDVPRRLVRVDRRGRETALPLEPGEYSFPALSPDGTRLAISVTRSSGASDIWLYDLESETRTRLTFEGFNQPPLWSPDGSSLVFSSGSQIMGNLFRKAADGTGTKEPLTSGVTGQFPHAWSRRGQIVFAQLSPERGLDLKMLDLESGGEPVTLLGSENSETRASVSPDGNWIAYTSNESGRDEVYIRPFPNVDAGKWQVSSDGGHSPIWLRAGGGIVYRGPGKMMSTRVSTESGTPVVEQTPTPLFDDVYVNDTGGRSYDVSADGSSFYMIRESGIGSANSSIRVLVNWFDELEELVPTY